MKRMKGMGGVYQPSYRDKKTGERVTVPTWWIYYNHRGKQIKESSHSTREADAWKLVKKRHGEMSEGKPVGPDVSRTTFEDMAAMVVSDHKANGRRSLSRYEDALNHLRGVFGQDRAFDITADRLTSYVAFRQEEEKAAAATINGELAVLSRMFVLAVRAGKAAHKPYIARLKVNNARKGFFEAEQFQAVLRRLSADIKPVVLTAFVTR